MNVKALCETKEYRAFAKKFKKPKALNNLGDLLVPCQFPDSSIVNTALDILVRLHIYTKTKAEKHDSLLQAIACYQGVFGEEISKKFGINQTDELDIQDLFATNKDFLFELCLRLAICENFYRSGILPPDLNKALSGFDIAKNELGLLYSNLKMPEFKNIIISPMLEFGSTYGEPDFIIDDCIWDLKCTSKENLKRDTFNQQVTYLLLANFLGMPIKKLGFLFPRFGATLVFDSSEIIGSDVAQLKQEVSELFKI